MLKKDFKRCKVQIRVLSHTTQKNRINCKQWNAKYETTAIVGKILLIVVVIIIVQ